MKKLSLVLTCVLVTCCASLGFSNDEKKSEVVAGTITGPTDVCLPATGKVYTLSGSSATSGYTWTLPTGATITAGVGSKTITVSFSSSNGGGMGQLITASGNGLSAQFNVNLYAMPVTGTIQGASSVCVGQANVSYNVSGFSNLTSFQWTPPSNVSLSSTTGGATQATFSPSFTSGTLSVTPYNGSCPGTAATKAISTPTLPITGNISGPATVTAGTNGVGYSVAGVPNATSYQWSVPSAATIATGSGTNSITVNFSPAFVGGYIYVNGRNGSCDGPLSPPLPANIPAAAGTISGNMSPCVGPSGTTVTYTVPAITNATTYGWVLSDGVIVGPSNTNSINVNFPAEITSNTVTITVRGANPQGAGAPSSINVTLYKSPGAAGPITGLSAVCAGQAGVIYSVPPITNALSYAWTLPSNVSIMSGSGTSSLMLSFASNFTGGNLSVMGIGGPCGSGASRTLTIQTPPLLPEAAGPLTGITTVCQGETNVTYSVPPIPHAEYYAWTLPSGANVVSNQKNVITVSFSGSATSGNITVRGSNCLGQGAISTLPITVRTIPQAPASTSGNTTPCLGESGVIYSIPALTHASSYIWTVPSGATIVSGQGTNTIVVDYALNASSGNITVRGANCVGLGPTTSFVINFGSSTLGYVSGEPASYNVDYATGTLSAGLPLFTLTHGDISVSGHLSYTASGVRVTDDDGLVGHNWNISTFSYGVFREMRSFPDDHSQDTRRGWLFGTARTTIKNNTLAPVDGVNSCTDEVPIHSTLNGINYNEDTEPDVFHVSAPNLVFDFYFDENKVPQVASTNDVIIKPYTSAGEFTPATSSGPITSFVVIDQNGVQYTFSEVESTTENMYKADQYYFVRRSNMHAASFTYNVSWRLTKIQSPVVGTVDFTYATYTFSPSDIEMISGMKAYLSFVSKMAGPRFVALNYYYNYPLITSNFYEAGSNLAYQRGSTFKILNKVTAATGEVEFVTAPKKAGSLLQRLNRIKITDKRDGAPKTVKEIAFEYSLSIGDRYLLKSVVKKVGCYDMKYRFDYLNVSWFPSYNSQQKDEWDFYEIPNSSSYDETAPALTLSKITHPDKGYSAFFYEAHQYWDGTANIQGGGIRIKAIVNYDGVSTAPDEGVQEFEYKAANGNSSGKLQHKSAKSISVARHAPKGYSNGVWYREFQVLNPSYTITQVNDAFTVKTLQDMSSSPTALNGNFVGYERVTVKSVGNGKVVYEYDIPASYGETTANSGEWTANKVLIARPSTGIANTCFEIPNLSEGYNQYPFPPPTNYDFARGLLKKTTSFNEAGAKVSDVVYEYQYIYPVGKSAITKIYGLTLEEMPTYYYNTSNSTYLSNKMFVYCRYPIFTNVDIVVKKETSTIYNSADELVKSQQQSTYNYTSANHRLISEILVQNSDGIQTKEKLIYAKDFTFTTPSGTEAIALANLNLTTVHRNVLVERRVSRTIQGTEQTVSASLTTFQTISGKVYPYKTFSFVAPDGSTLLSATTAGGSTFNYDQTDYVLNDTYLSFDAYGNVREIKGKDRNVSGVLFGLMGQVPVFSFRNAQLGELMYHDFDDIISTNTSFNFTPTYTTGRHNSKALNLPAGSDSGPYLANSIVNNRTKNYIISFWAKATTAGTISLKVGPGTVTTYSHPFTSSADFKYYSFKIPVSEAIGSASGFYMNLWSSAAVIIDDLAFYPEQTDFKTTRYVIPNGVIAETDSRGTSVYYDRDVWGRLKVVYDRDKNVKVKYNYQTRP